MSQLSVTNSDFTPSTIISSSQIDQNFADVVSWANGNIQQDNFATLTGAVNWTITSNVLGINIASNSTAGIIKLTQTGSGDFIKGVTAAGDVWKINSSGHLAFIGALNPGWQSNMGLLNATTSVTDDSIKVSGSGAVLSANNPLYVCVPSTTVGRLTCLTATADVSIKLSGAVWGFDGIGDLTGIELRLYAINDNGTLKWGVASKAGLRSIADSNSSATPANITAATKMLVNSALSAGTWPCVEVGSFLANFTDSSNAWAVQSSVGSITVGAKTSQASSVRYARATTVNVPAAGTIGDNVLLFNVLKEDTYGDYDTATGIFTARVAGLYQVGVTATITTGGTWAAGNEWTVGILKGSTVYNRLFSVYSQASHGTYMSGAGTDTIRLAVGDTIKIYGYQTSSGDLNLHNDASLNHMFIMKVGD